MPEKQATALRWLLLLGLVIAGFGITWAAVLFTQQPAGFEQLKGRWKREDGDYILDIRGVDSGGKLDAEYLNPRPIHIVQAEATQENGVTNVFIELRDAGYPGAIYELTYQAERDRLEGTYYQPAIQQLFEVVFVRMK